jgi:Na+/proline symporter
VPIANTGAAMGLVVLPALIGPLYWPRGTTAGAIGSLAVGLLFMLLTLEPTVKAWLLPASGYLSFPAMSGLLLSSLVYVGVSLVTCPPPPRKQRQYHGYLSRVLYGATPEDRPNPELRAAGSLQGRDGGDRPDATTSSQP